MISSVDKINLSCFTSPPPTDAAAQFFKKLTPSPPFTFLYELSPNYLVDPLSN